MLNHELVPSRRGNGRQGTHRAGTVRPGTGGGSREEPQEPSSRPTLSTLLAPGLGGRGCGCALGSPPPSGTFHGTRPAPSRAQAPSGTPRASREGRGSGCFPTAGLLRPAPLPARQARYPKRARTRIRCLWFDLPSDTEPGTVTGSVCDPLGRARLQVLAAEIELPEFPP